MEQQKNARQMRSLLVLQLRTYRNFDRHSIKFYNEHFFNVYSKFSIRIIYEMHEMNLFSWKKKWIYFPEKI